MDNLDWKKQAATIQPMDCKCLPQMFKLIVQDAIMDQNSILVSDLKSSEEAIAKYPAMAKRATERLNENPQYLQGLVTAKDLRASWTPEFAAELKEQLELNAYLLRQLDSIPNCE